MDSLEIIKMCYEWQINNLKVQGWAQKLREDREKTGLEYIWQSQRTWKKKRFRIYLAKPGRD
jgi:hypothetical protein